MPHLRPCARCDRHVLAAQTACPFCGAALEMDLREPLAPPGRLGRAALIALAASVAACHEDAPKQTAAPEPAVSQAASAAPSTIASATAAPTASAAPSPSMAPSTMASVAPDAGKPKVLTTASALPPPTWRNMAKPYGAPPARDRRV